MPEVSVVIPTYNRQHLVQQTIDSVLRQTFRDWELIVVDDGSTDDTSDVLSERYGSRIRYVYQRNQGESAARNHGIELAHGQYIAFLDSDDLWHREKLQRQMEVFGAFPDVGIVSTQASWINYEGLLLKQPPHGHDQSDEVISWDDLVLDNVVAGGGSSAIVRRTCVDHAGGFDSQIRFGEEWDLWIRIARHYQVRQLPEPLVFFRVHRFGTRSWAPRAQEAGNLFGEHRAILERAFADCPHEPPRCEELKNLAFARISLRHAIVDLALGNAISGREHWLTAIRLCPGYAADAEVVLQTIVNYATGYASLAEPSARVAALVAIMDRILANLPSELAQLRKERGLVVARSFAEMAFSAAMNEDGGFARRCAYRCLLADPSWRSNRGLLKILVTGGRHLRPQPLAL